MVERKLNDYNVIRLLEDVEEYEQRRGFVFDNIREWLPGKKIFAFEDVGYTLHSVSAET